MRTRTRTGGGAPSPGAAKSRKLKVSEGVAIGALIVLVLAEVIAFGASEYAVSMAFSALHALFLVGLLASCRWARKSVRGLASAPLWAGFAVVLLAIAWALTPFGPGGAHPVWSYVEPKGGSIAVDRSGLVLSLLRLCGLACLFLAAQIVGASETRRRTLYWFLLLALGAYAGAAIIHQVSVRATGRLTATLLSPNSAATLLGVGVVYSTLFVTQVVQRTGGALKLDKLPLDAAISLGLTAVFAVALALTASRAGIFATVVALAILLTWQVLAQGKKVRVVAIVGGAAVLLVAIGIAMRSAELTATRLENLNNDMAARQSIFGAHWEAFKAAPWFGYGLGSFPVINQLIMTSETLPVLFDVRATHNLYLQWLEETGIVGGLSMAVLLAVIVWPIAVSATKSGTSGALARAAIAAIVLVLLHGLSDFAVQVPALQAVFALGLGALTASSKSLRAQRLPSLGVVSIFSGAVLIGSFLAAVPLVSARFGEDLSYMPTAPAEVLATSIESGLARDDRSPAALARLETLADRELAMRPGTGAAWLRKAAVAYRRGDIVAANEALSRSYAVAPLQTSAFVARTRLAYEHWAVLTPALREQVIYQAVVEYNRPQGDARLSALANSIRDDSGRIGLALLIAAQRAAQEANQ